MTRSHAGVLDDALTQSHATLLPRLLRHLRRQALRQVFKIMKGYGEHWQYSIFFCILKPIDRVRMQGDLEDVMNLKQDQVLIIDLGENQDTRPGRDDRSRRSRWGLWTWG